MFEVVNGNYVAASFVYLTPGQRQINLDATQHTIIDQHQFVLVTTLTDYGIKHDEFFTVSITECTITQMTVGTPTQTFFLYDVKQVPTILSIDLPPITLSPTICPFNLFLSI